MHEDSPPPPSLHPDALVEEPPHTERSARRFGLGHLPDAPDARDWRAGARFGAPRALPPEASLEGHVRRIVDQGPTSACVGCALGTAVDVRLRRLGVQAPEPSRKAIYDFARGYSRTDPHAPLFDRGCFPRAAMWSLRESGVPSEERWPFRVQGIDDEPPFDVHQAAATFRIAAWWRVDAWGEGRLDQIAMALASGFPVVYGRLVGRAFEDYAGRGLVEATEPKDSLGGHMTTLVGYVPRAGRPGERAWRGVNSWGAGWGDKGFYWASDASLVSGSATDFYVLEVRV